MDPREVREERIGLGGAAAILGRSASTVRRYVGEGRLPAVPFERYERLLQLGQDYKTRLEERTHQIEEVKRERDAARMEIDRLWSEIERLNLVEFQRELQEKTISTLEEEKAKLESERDRLTQEKTDLVEEKATLYEERVRLEAELDALKNRGGFWSRLFGGWSRGQHPAARITTGRSLSS